MCGIAGFAFSMMSGDEARQIAGRMASSLDHRGPDDSGVWCDDRVGVSLGHTRLAVIDPSPLGRQPMASADGRFVLAFNGEIYNHRTVRKDLSTRFRGDSDTEVLVEAIASWGVDQALRRVDGMFAFAVWDRELGTLTLARDRLGEKPLYYGFAGRTFLFGSELKSFLVHPAFEARIDRSALTLYFRYGYVPTPHSIYQGVHKLPPGTLVEVSADAPPWTSGPGPVREYWSLRQVAGESTSPYADVPAEHVLDEFDDVLARSVRERMVADVPLGAFLSGGIDSTAIVAMMQRQSDRPVRTFTVGIDSTDYDESAHAARVARFLGTDHTELRVTGDDAVHTIPSLPHVYDEPFADSSQIPTMLISRLTRQHVTVALSGDGGDELFGGYTRYLLYRRVWDRLGAVPAPVRTGMARGIQSIPDGAWDRIGAIPAVQRRVSRPREKARKLAAVLPLESPEQMYHHLMSQWSDPGALVVGGVEPPDRFEESRTWSSPADATQRLMLLDALTYLPDDILTKVDRASMAASLEVRVPFLGREVVEFAWRLPLDLKIRGDEGKWLLRRLVDRHVPSELMDRPKMGFGIPVGDWLRGPLRGWAEDLLSPARLRADGFLAVAPVREVWARHLHGSDLTFPLWTVLMFQSWLDSVSPATAAR